MASEERPEDALELAEEGPERDTEEEAPQGASSPEPVSSGHEHSSGHEQRQRARAGAAYAAAQSSAIKRPAPAEAEAEPELGPEPGPEPGPELGPQETPGADEEAGLQVQLDLEELAAKADRADEYLALAQRTQADFDNYRKRAAREAALAQDRGVAKLAKELLPAIDNLDRALQAAGEEQSPLAEGIRFVHSDLLSALARVGVEPFSPGGEPFDPQLHEAVAQQPVEGVESGTVAEVFQQGFRLGDSVLRPARVLVAA